MPKKSQMKLMMRKERIDSATGERTLVGTKPTTARESAMYAKAKGAKAIERTPGKLMRTMKRKKP